MLAELREKTERLLAAGVRGIQVNLTLAETGRGLDKLMEAVIRTHQVWNRRVSTGKLKPLAGRYLVAPSAAGRRRAQAEGQIRHPGQDPSARFRGVVPAPGSHAAEPRYLSNSLREAFDMPGVPIRIVLRGLENPYAGKAKSRK